MTFFINGICTFLIQNFNLLSYKTCCTSFMQAMAPRSVNELEKPMN